jgi:hypothetical protein
LRQRLLKMAWFNGTTPPAFSDLLFSHPNIASLRQMRKRVDFRWESDADVVWITFCWTHGSGSMEGHPWSMGKEQARQLWTEMVTLGWECPDGGVGHGA